MGAVSASRRRLRLSSREVDGCDVIRLLRSRRPFAGRVARLRLAHVAEQPRGRLRFEDVEDVGERAKAELDEPGGAIAQQCDPPNLLRGKDPVRNEERDGRAEPLPATPAGRLSWAGGHFAVTLLGPALRPPAWHTG